MVKPDEAPVLKGWVTSSTIAEELGISRQTVNQMMHSGEFGTLHRLAGSAQKPQFVVSREEFDKIKETRSFPRSKKAEVEEAS